MKNIWARCWTLWAIWRQSETETRDDEREAGMEWPMQLRQQVRYRH